MSEIEYSEITAADFAAKAALTFEIEDFEMGVLLRGRCPRCEASMEVAVVDVVFRDGDRPAASAEAGSEREEPVVCTCADDHPGRPPGRTGCGAYWVFVIPGAGA